MLNAIFPVLNRIYDDEFKRKCAFGQRVLDLRRRRKLSRNQLDQLSGVPERTIIDIENAEKATLDRKTVMLLARAFDLHGMDLREFVLAAGLAPEHSLDAPDLTAMIRRFFRESDYPAYMTNALFDLHACNSYLMALMGISMQYLETLAYRGAGPNMLRFLFDPALNTRATWGNAWRDIAIWNVRVFRQGSLLHVHQPRYTQLLRELRQLPDFDAVWQASAAPQEMTLPPHISTVQSPYGPAKVLHAEVITDEVIHRQLRVALYVPLDETTQAVFATLRQKVTCFAIQFGSVEVGRFTRLL